MNKTKSFEISKMLVVEAYKQVKKNKGAAGIDNKTMADFDADLKNNLFKIWNRMSSGSYFPPPVKMVPIPKKDGGVRMLGIPTIGDRIAQTVVKMMLEPILEPIFHEDSYGYRPNKSAHQAVEVAKQRCWVNKWTIDLDIKGFFDNLNHELVLKSVKHHTNNRLILLYVERWLKCPVIDRDGNFVKRDKGTPQGGVISPLLANLYLHYAFDSWITRVHRGVKFERYADDIVIHCNVLVEAQKVLKNLNQRMIDCGLELHPDKTKIVYCSQAMIREKVEFPQEFDFLGFTFKRRTIKTKHGKLRDGFLPGLSKSSKKQISAKIKQWYLPTRTDFNLQDISKRYNPALRGWFNYYGQISVAAYRPVQRHVREVLTNWAVRKFKRFKGSRTNAGIFIDDVLKKYPKMFSSYV